jgi:dolichyl-phosphate beta-glucosyltransferase
VASEVDLSVIIPAYNEEHRLPGSLRQLKAYLEPRRGNFEIILSDDGSRDGTLAVMEDEARRHHYVRVVHLPENRGKGRALAEGVAVSSGRLVLITDADLSAPIDELPDLEAALSNGAGVAIASRAKKGSKEVSQPLPRMVMGKTFNLAVQAMLLPGLWDTQCGFKLFPGDLARELFGELKTDGFAFDVEILYRAKRRGRKIKEVPVHWVHSAPTRVLAVRHSAQMIKDLFRIRLGFN